MFVLIFHMTLIIHWKVKGKGIMNFKCQQEDQCSKDKLVSFLGSKLSLSSLDTLLLAVRGPVCLYQHLSTVLLAHMRATHTHKHTHTSAVMCFLISIHIYSQQLATVGQLSLSLSAPPSCSSPVSPFLCASALVISRYI